MFWRNFTRIQFRRRSLSYFDIFFVKSHFLQNKIVVKLVGLRKFMYTWIEQLGFSHFANFSWKQELKYLAIFFFWNGQDSNPLSKCKKRIRKQKSKLNSRFLRELSKIRFSSFDIFFVKPKSMKSKNLSIDLTNFSRIGKENTSIWQIFSWKQKVRNKNKV